MKKYANAKEVLPERLIEEIQKYAQGMHLYIPTKTRKPWGSHTGIRDELKRRNAEIVRKYRSGIDIPKLAELYSLSEERIQSIIYAAESD
jgi:Mor family transcriptional regulator